MRHRKLSVSKMLALGLLISYSTHIEANIANETTGIQQNNTYKVSGVVTDTNGEPVIGASIVEKAHPMEQSQTLMENSYSKSMQEPH